MEEDEDKEYDQILKAGLSALKTPKQRPAKKNGKAEKEGKGPKKNGKNLKVKKDLSSSDDEVFPRNRHRQLAIAEDDSDDNSKYSNLCDPFHKVCLEK